MKDAEKKPRACFMEYVIVAVLILAAILVAALFFGKDIMNMFGTAGSATIGNDAAVDCKCQSAANDRAGHQAATQSWKSKSNATRCAADEDKCKEGHRAAPQASTVNPVPIPDDGGSTPSEEFNPASH